jgi:HlyD family secretion protein
MPRIPPQAVFFALLVLLLPGCGGNREDGVLLSSGHVEATDVRISPKVGGRILRLAAGEGDRVSSGQLLVRIDDVDIRIALKAVEAERAAAAADLSLKRAGSRPEEIAEAEAQAELARAELAGARRDFDRLEALFERGAATEKARDDARTRRDVTAKALEAAAARLERLRAGFRRQEIDAARARLQAADAEVARLRQQLDDASVKSPLSGIVTVKAAEPGEIVSPGETILVVTDLDNAWLTVYVDGPFLERIRLGQEVEVVTDAGEARAGRIIFIASRAEFTPKTVQTREERVKLVYKVKVGLDNRDGLFKPGMPAEARIPAAESLR